MVAPGGAYGDRKEMLATFASHEHMRAVTAALEGEDTAALQRGAAESVKRVKLQKPDADWFSETHDSPYSIRDFTEAKTVWHPIGA